MSDESGSMSVEGAVPGDGGLRGMMTLTELQRSVSSEEIETVIVVFTDLYGRFMGKRFDAEFFLESVTVEGTHACDYLLTVDMEMEPVQGYEYANWALGYGDFHLVPDMGTLRRAAWLTKSALVICDVVDPNSHLPVSVAPRSILRAQLARADALGFEAFAASELEYYIFENTYREARERDYRELRSSGWYIEDYHSFQGAREEKLNALVRRSLRDSGVPVENSKGEWGPGQHELNVRYTDALQMADCHVVYKQCLRETADKLDMSVTFMAKFSSELAGSSCHIHMSLWRNGFNAFAGDGDLAGIACSDAFRWFLGGWIQYVPDVMVFYAPTVNAYKRYESGSWAPTERAWSRDNRTAGFRVVGSGSSLRIECRFPGADCNPYLAYAAALASGLAGIEDQIEPPEMFVGDVYNASDQPHVPRSLIEAIECFRSSDFARRVFGEAVVHHYTHFFRTEQQAFDRSVTDWERRRYFEQI